MILIRGAGALIVLTAMGCGSRSGLLGADPGPSVGGSAGAAASGGSGGGGGVGATGGLGGTSGSAAFGGSAGSGGSAGAGGSGACAALALATPIAQVQADASDSDQGPVLALSSADGQGLTVAFARQPVESPGPFTEIRHATLSPWMSWPASPIEPVHSTFAHPQLTTQIAVDSAPANRFALLVAHEQSTSFAPRVHPHQSNAGPTTTPAGTGVRFVALSQSGSGRHLVGTLTSQGELVATEVATKGNELSVASSVVLGCASSPLPADAVAYQDGWLVALGNGQNVPPGSGCPTGGAAAGQPTRLDFVRVHPGGTFDFVTGPSEPVAIADVRLGAHASGAWFAYRIASGGVIAPIRVGRADAVSFGLVGPSDLSGPSDVPLEFDATNVGGRFVVAWGNDPAGNPPDLMLSVLDDSLSLTSQAAFEPSFFGPPAVIGSPNGDSLVVAWSTGGLARRVELARFDCVK